MNDYDLNTLKVGDKVFNATFGNGIVHHIDNSNRPLGIKFGLNLLQWFTRDGRFTEDLPLSLFKGHFYNEVQETTEDTI